MIYDNQMHMYETMHTKGYQYVCIDKRELTPYTDVTATLGVSETPKNAFVFTKINTLKPETLDPSENFIFAHPIDGCLLSHDDRQMQQFSYKNEDADLDIEPKLKYFWRGIACVLNASGVVVGNPSKECTLMPNSIIVWRGNAMANIQIINTAHLKNHQSPSMNA
jgi:hypothetical protein